MGAELQVESVPGSGSRFYFALPLVPADDAAVSRIGSDAEPPLDARLAPGQQVTALVVDDSTVSRRILGQPARERRFPGDHRHRRPRRRLMLATSHRPDVIFMDVKMADLDGFSATRRLAADEATAHIPVIAVTASAFGDTRQAARGRRLRRLPAQAGARRGAVRRAADAPRPRVRQRRRARRRRGDVPLGDRASRDAELAARLREAVAIGAVTDLEAIADELAARQRGRGRARPAPGALAANFDFDGVRELAASLDGARGGRDAD